MPSSPDPVHGTDTVPLGGSAPFLVAHPLVAATRRIEESSSVDGLRRVYAVASGPVDRTAGGDLLRSGLIGHALHPLLTDVPLGCWTAATILDLRGRRQDRGAARSLVGAGLAAVAPTVLTGLAEWARADVRAQRVGAVHGILNGVATSLYLASFVVRPRRHAAGVGLALAGATVASVSGYLGGHLTTARKVGSRDPALDHP